MVCSHTENQDQASFCPSAPLEISVLAEHTLGHLQVYRSSQAPPPVLSTRCRVTPPRRVSALDTRSKSPLDAGLPTSLSKSKKLH